MPTMQVHSVMSASHAHADGCPQQRDLRLGEGVDVLWRCWARSTDGRVADSSREGVRLRLRRRLLTAGLEARTCEGRERSGERSKSWVRAQV